MFDPEAPVTPYIPEAAGSAYGDASVRHVLDMSVSLDFEEAYLDPESAFARYRRATLWNPGGGTESLREFILTLQRLAEPHGQTFRYRSPNSDLLGILLERASGQRFTDLMREKLWLPLGAVSEASIGGRHGRHGAHRRRHFGDAARSGARRRDDAARRHGQWPPHRAGSLGARHDRHRRQRGGLAARHDGVPVSARPLPQQMVPDGRGQAVPSAASASTASGSMSIRRTEVVIAKMSSQPEPVDDPLDLEIVAFFEALSRMV